ncbi:hypothetical protein CSUI_003227 [Cystoisospora suis]|uniref:Uncharacterized protein n=1 Tax=Cystoisospora suis TaxID=483139 RepID=A0A2C6KFW4_9APIC|nr:hypothetical protein CSUI_003227 [Cystoisospora suis]
METRLRAELSRVAFALATAVAGAFGGAPEPAAITLAEVAARAATETEETAATAVRRELQLRLKAPEKAKSTVRARLKAAEMPISKVRAEACRAATTSEMVAVPEEMVDAELLVKVVHSQMIAVQASVAEATESALNQQEGRAVAHEVAKQLRTAALAEANQLQDALKEGYRTVERRAAEVAADVARRASTAAWRAASGLVKARIDELDARVEVETTKALALAEALKMEGLDPDTRSELIEAEKLARLAAQSAAAERLRAEFEALDLDEATREQVLEHLDEKQRVAANDISASAPSAGTGAASPLSPSGRSAILTPFSRESRNTENTGRGPHRSKSASAPPRTKQGDRRPSF